MELFKDREGREWKIVIDVAQVRAVRASELKFDLLDIKNGDLFIQLSEDPVLLVGVLYILCQEQAETYGVSDVKFGQGMAGGVLELATAALLKELISFFPSQKRRVLTRALEKMKEGEGLATVMAIEKIDKLDLNAEMEKLEKKLEAQQSASGEQSGGSPGTSA